MSNQTPDLTPYLGLRARLSQVWLNRWTILLLLVLVRVLLSIASIDDNLGDAREKALSACTKVESAGSALVSMPYYMSKGVNELTASGIERAVNGLMKVLDLTIVGVQEIVIFVINMLIGTYTCLITLVVGGAIEVALNLIKEVTGFLNEALPAIGNSIQDAASVFEGGIDKIVSALNSIPFVDNKIPEFNIGDDLDKLNNLQIPASFTEDLDSLKDKIPDFKEVQEFINDIIRLPFGKIRELIKEEVETYTFDRSLFPVPVKEELKFCNEGGGLNGFFDKLVALLNKGKKLFIGIIAILAILVCAPIAYMEIKRFRKEEARARDPNNARKDPMEIVYMSSRPNTGGTGEWISKKIFKSSSIRGPVLVRWVIAYATSPPALFVLSLAVAGFFACVCQYAMLQSIKNEVPDITDQVAQFAGMVTDKLDTASKSWQNGTNMALRTTNDNINEKLFGWVDTSTTAVNDTLNAVVDKITEGLDKAFGGTILYDPIKGVMDCLILYKIQGIQSGLTWVQSAANIEFPTVPNDTFSLGALAAQTPGDSDDKFLLAPGDKTKDELSQLVDKLVAKIQSGILTEAAISAGLLGVWLLVLIIGITWAIFQSSKGSLSTWNERDNNPNDFYDPSISPQASQGSDQYNDKDAGVHNALPPSYEQSHPGPVNKAAPYVLSAVPFQPSDSSRWQGNVQQRSADIIQPSHQRMSSQGDVENTTPVDDKRDHTSPLDEKKNNPTPSTNPYYYTS